MELAAKDSLPARCPNCRNEYDAKRITFSAPSQAECVAVCPAGILDGFWHAPDAPNPRNISHRLEKLQKSKRKEKVKGSKEIDLDDRRRLQDLRVLQRDRKSVV